jgi:hypothetical protein
MMMIIIFLHLKAMPMRYLYGLEYYIHTGKTIHEKLDENLYVTWLRVLISFDCEFCARHALLN